MDTNGINGTQTLTATVNGVTLQSTFFAGGAFPQGPLFAYNTGDVFNLVSLNGQTVNFYIDIP